MVSRYLHKHDFPKKSVKHSVIMEAVSILVHCRSMMELRSRVREVGTILIGEKKTREFHEALSSLSQTGLEDCEDTGLKTEEEHEEKDEAFFNEAPKATVYASSPFYQEFLVVFDSLKVSLNGTIDATETDNEFKSEIIAQYLLKSLLPYVAMWSALLITDKSIKHHGNASAENYMKILKASILNKEKSLKAGRAIDEIHNATDAALIEINLQTPQQHTKKRTRQMDKSINNHSDEAPPRKTSRPRDKTERKRNINEPDDMRSEEAWSKNEPKTKATKRHADLTTLKSMQSETEKKTLRKYPNGCISNEKYYFSPEGTAPRRCFVGVVPKNPAKYDAREDLQSLFHDDYSRLFEDQPDKAKWLSGDLIDYSYRCGNLHGDYNLCYAYVECIFATSSLENPHRIGPHLKARFRRDWEDTDGMFFPINAHGVHWILLFVDVEANTTYVLDPSSRSSNEESSVHAKFAQLWQEVFPEKKIEWDVSDCEYPRQKDGYNCGIFILHYMTEILRNGALEIRLAFDPAVARQEWRLKCLTSSMDTTNLCLKCGQGESNRRRTWVICDVCEKVIHISCLAYLNKTQKEIESPFFVFICDLCSQWKNTS